MVTDDNCVLPRHWPLSRMPVKQELGVIGCCLRQGQLTRTAAGADSSLPGPMED